MRDGGYVLTCETGWELRGFEPRIDQAKYWMNCRFAPPRFSSFPLPEVLLSGVDGVKTGSSAHAPATRDPINANAHTPMITTIAQPMRLANQLLTWRPMIARLLPTNVIIAIKGGARTPLTAAA